MGANCCVVAREKPLPDGISGEVSSYRNVRHSPSWSFRWDNRTHIEDIVDNPSRFSLHNSGNVGSEIKSAADTDTDGLSDGGSPSGSLHNPKLLKKVGITGSLKSTASDLSTKSNLSAKEKSVHNSSAVAKPSDMKPSVSSPFTPSSSSFKAADPSPFRSCSLDPSSSRMARRSPGYQLSRQVSDSRIPSLNCSPDGRQSFVLSFCSNDLSAGGSHGGSSDGWSMRTFTELVAASSQRERWSLDSDLSTVNNKLATSSPPSGDLQTCRVCSKLLKEKSPWSAQKIVSTTNELSVAAVLVCGHVYHAECLESMTSETDRYDPTCPVCTNGDKLTPKLLARADLKARNKISRRAVADIDVDGDSASRCVKRGSKSPSMGASSSTKGSFGKPPFLRRHFSIGSRPPPARSVSESDSSRKKKGFWSRYYHRD